MTGLPLQCLCKSFIFNFLKDGTIAWNLKEMTPEMRKEVDRKIKQFTKEA
jgi:hypothetical protein